MNDLGDRLQRASDQVSPSDEPYERLLRRRDSRRRRERLLAGGVSVLLVIGVVGGVLAVLSRSSGHGVRSGEQPPQSPAALELGPGQDLYLKRTLVLPNGSVVLESWWATDGSGRIEFSCTIPDCEQTYGAPNTGTFGAGKFPTDDDVSGLSPDPTVLEAQLLERSGEGGSSPRPAFSPGPELTPGVTAGALWDAVANILEDQTGGPDLRAALFDVASGITGVEVQTGVTDPGGRAATALILADSANGPVAMYFDPATKQLLAMGDAPGQISSDGYAVFDEAIVNGTDDRPTADQWLFPQAAGVPGVPTPTP